MSKISIEIDLAHLGVEYDEDGEPMPGPQMQDLIVQALAERMWRDQGGDRSMRERAERLLNERVEAVIDPIIQEIATGPIQKRHSWGDKAGEETTLREIVRGHMEQFFAKGLTRDTYDRGRNPQSVPDIVAEVTKDVLTTDMRKAVDEARREVNDTVKRTIIAKVVETLNGR